MGVLSNIQPPDLSGFFEAQWKERVDTLSPNSAQFAINRSQAELEVLLPWSAEESVIKQTLGYQYVDTTAKKLCRVLPLRHPRFRWMFASRIFNERGIKPIGKEVKVQFNSGVGGASRLSAWMGYELIQLTVSFEPVPYRVLRDDEIGGNEYNRFVEIRPKPGEDVIQQQAGSMFFAEGAGTGGEPTAGSSSFARTLGVIEPKNFYTMIWHKVPLEFVSPDRGLTFPKLDSLLGAVNDSEYLGRPPGTLLMRAPNISPYPQSVNVLDETEPSLLVDIEINLHHFDPVRRNSDDYRGHNIVPAANRVHYLVTHNGSTSGQRIYREADFSDIFKHWDA